MEDGMADTKVEAQGGQAGQGERCPEHRPGKSGAATHVSTASSPSTSWPAS